MPRPTPIVSLSEEQSAALRKVMQGNPVDSTPYKRAGVLLACAEGKPGKEIAKQYGISSNAVINWRRKFENGGVEGLLSNARKNGKSMSADDEMVEKVRAAMLITQPYPDEPWTLDALAKYLEMPASSVQKVLKQLEMTLPEDAGEAEPVFPDLKKKKVQIIGLFLTSTVQILALVISPSKDTPVFPEAKKITTTVGSRQEREYIKKPIRESDLLSSLWFALFRLKSLPPSEEPDSSISEAACFVQNLQNSLQNTGKSLSLVLNAPNPSAIVSDQSLVCMSLSSTSVFNRVALQWFYKVTRSTLEADGLYDHVRRLLGNSPHNCVPLVWQVGPEDHRAYQPGTVSSALNQFAGENELTITLEYKDAHGEAVSCSTAINAVPGSTDFSQCKTLQGFQNLLGELEQSLIKGSNAVVSDFMNQFLNTGSVSANRKESNKEPKKR